MCFRFLGAHTQKSYLMQEDFSKLGMTDGWDTWVDQHGQGFAVEYPIRVQKVVRSSPQSYKLQDGKLQKAPCVKCEWVSIDFLKVVYSLARS